MPADPQTHMPELAIGQVWKPKRGKARKLLPRQGLGITFVTLPDNRTGHCLDSYAFRQWIERYGAVLQEETL